MGATITGKNSAIRPRILTCGAVRASPTGRTLASVARATVEADAAIHAGSAGTVVDTWR